MLPFMSDEMLEAGVSFPLRDRHYDTETDGRVMLLPLRPSDDAVVQRPVRRGRARAKLQAG